MRAALAACLLALAPWAATAGGDPADDAAALHSTHCTRCHDAAVYTRANRIVTDLDQLRERVRQCELMAGAGWFDEEVEAVVRWLDREYYHFGR